MHGGMPDARAQSARHAAEVQPIDRQRQAIFGASTCLCRTARNRNGAGGLRPSIRKAEHRRWKDVYAILQYSMDQLHRISALNDARRYIFRWSYGTRAWR